MPQIITIGKSIQFRQRSVKDAKPTTCFEQTCRGVAKALVVDELNPSNANLTWEASIGAVFGPLRAKTVTIADSG
jgi:hypothetical protein